MHPPVWADSVLGMNTSQIIKQQMESQGLSINTLAQETLIPRVTLQRKLSGRADFTVTEVRHIAKALGVKTSALVDPQAEAVAA